MEHRRTYTLLALVLMPFFVKAQDAKVSADTSVFELGDQISLTLDFALPGGWEPRNQNTLVWPVITDTLNAQVEVISTSPIDTITLNNGRLQLSQALIITAFDTGYVVVNPIAFQYGGEIHETNPLLLYVATPDLDETGPRDVKDILEVNYSFFDRVMEHIIWIMSGVLLVILLIVVIRYFKRRKTKQPEEEAIPVVQREPAHLEALKALRELESKELWQKGEDKTYQSILTDILRTYIERRYKVATFERTSREFLHDLRLTGIDSDALAQLRATLELADMVKFAKYRPLNVENERAMQNAIDFIEKTTPNQASA